MKKIKIPDRMCREARRRLMNVLLSLIVVVLLGGIAFLGGGAGGARVFFGVVIPYSALSIFLLGICYRVILWSLSAVPFSIPTTSGQQKTLPWIKNSRFDSPYGTFGVIVRMAMEVLLFRSLLKNSKAELRRDPVWFTGKASSSGWPPWLSTGLSW